MTELLLIAVVVPFALLALCGFVMGIYATIKVMAFEESTHKVEFVPIGAPDDPKDPENFDIEGYPDFESLPADKKAKILEEMESI